MQTPTTGETLATLARRFGDALRAADSARANAIVREALLADLAPEAVQAGVIAPAINWIGDLWAQRALTVADEHLATAISYGALAEIYPALVSRGERREQTVVVSAVEGEQHVLGARMAADVLEGAGFKTLFLGADVPTGALGVAVAGHGADVVCLSLHMPLGIARLERAVAAVQEARPSARILLGGRGVPARLRARFPYVEATTDLLDVLDAALSGPEHPPVTISDVVEPQFEIAPAPLEARLADATAQTAELARENARQAERFRRLAFQDELTGLPNRRAFEDYLTEASASDSPAMLIIDVDGFKLINDSLGHLEGDAVLKRLAQLIQSAIRPTDYAARVGGDEFAVLLTGGSPYEAVCVAERLRSVIEDDEAEPRVTVSIGVSQCSGDMRGAALEADRALYAAKRGGRNAVQFAAE